MALVGTLPRTRLFRYAFKVFFFMTVVKLCINVLFLDQCTNCSNQQTAVENRFLGVKLFRDHCPLNSSNLSKSQS